MTGTVLYGRFSGPRHIAIIHELPIHDEARNAVIGCSRQVTVDIQPIVNTCRDADTLLWAMQYAYSEVLHDLGTGHELRLGLLDMLHDDALWPNGSSAALNLGMRIYRLFWGPEYQDCQNVTLLWAMIAAIVDLCRQLEIATKDITATTDILVRSMPGNLRKVEMPADWESMISTLLSRRTARPYQN